MHRCVPHYLPAVSSDIERFQHLLDQLNRVTVLTGAGVSTESGIPDYRSEKVGRFARTSVRPVQYQDFIKSASARRRYWARNYVGWPQFSSFLPNVNHKTLRDWELKGRLHWLITQNVDSLHTKAGSKNVTELHGSAARVRCLSCKEIITRDKMQTLIESLNPTWSAQAIEVAPDGDVDIPDYLIDSFNTPSCPKCTNGTLQPDVVFFGDNVPRDVVEFCFEKVTQSDGLLVLGSSLHVFSGYRFVRKAVDCGKPVLMINIGDTRADSLLNAKLSCRCSDILPQLTCAHKTTY